MTHVIMPKAPGMQEPTEVVMDRLRRRMTGYRNHHDDCAPRFEYTINGLNSRQKRETLTLRQRFLESKSKKSAKKSDKSKQEGSNSSGASKLQNRQSEDIDVNSGGKPGSECYEPPTKKITAFGNVSTTSNSVASTYKYHQGQSQSQSQSAPTTLKSPLSTPTANFKNESLNKCPLELAHQNDTLSEPVDLLQNSKEFTNSSFKQGSGSAVSQIASPMSDHSAMGVIGSPNSSYSSPSNANNIEFKTEPNSDFVDLDQCAAALEKDASIMSALIGDVSSKSMINYDTLKDLISEISNNPDFIKDFDDFDDDHHSSNKNVPAGSSAPTPTHSHSTNPCTDNNPSVSGHGLSRTPPVAPVTPTISSPRLSQAPVPVRMQHQQGVMMRPGLGEMVPQQIIGGQNAVMNRFPSLSRNPSANSVSSRPSSEVVMGTDGLGRMPNPNISNLRMQQIMHVSRHGTSPVGSSNTLMVGNISMNTMNAPTRRMPSFDPIDVGPNSATIMPPRPGPGGGGSMNIMMPSQPQQQSKTLPYWMGMSDPNARNYPGPNLQQPPRQIMRPNTNSSNFHPAMGIMQMGQQPHLGMSQSQNQLQRGDGTMCGMGVPVQGSGQLGIGRNAVSNMGYGQQQIQVGGNPGNFSQSPIVGVGNKMSQPLVNMCVSSNFPMKSGVSGMAVNNSMDSSSGGTMMCASSQSVNQMVNPRRFSSELANQDFTYELLENITSSDPSPFHEDLDFLSSFDSTPNYILDSL